MIIEIKDLTEAQVEMVTEALSRMFEYDVDFTTLYRGAWVMSGIKFMGDRAIVAAETAVAYLAA